MECNFGVLKDSAFLSTKILKIIEINNFFSKKINNLAKQLQEKLCHTMPHIENREGRNLAWLQPSAIVWISVKNYFTIDL